MFPFLYRKEIEDEFAQDNFVRIQDYFRNQALDRCEFSFYRIPITAAVTSYKYPHGLTFVPQDIVVTQNSTNAVVTFNWSEFDSKFISITTDGPTNLRLLMGRYEDG